MIGSNKETFYLIPTFHTLGSEQIAILDRRGEQMQEGQVLWAQVGQLALQNAPQPHEPDWRTQISDQSHGNTNDKRSKRANIAFTIYSAEKLY